MNFEELQRESVMLREAANLLNKKLEEFTDLLGTIPGRIETHVTRGDFTLIFRREGKFWVLACIDGDRPVQLVSEARLLAKIQAVSLVEDLVPAMVTSCTDLKNKVVGATAQLDALCQRTREGLKVK